MSETVLCAERQRLEEDRTRTKNWKRWGPYLSERQWGTVREDYSDDGSSWDFFPHEHARSRAFRWGEDGLLGICDRQCRLCFALALWNGQDPILKERLFGLTGSEGNHGEDVKECYFYLDATPTHSYLKGLYKYPQTEFPYAKLIEENRKRGLAAPEFELTDTGVFDQNRYFDVFVEYAKRTPDDVLIRLTLTNRGPDPAVLHVLPTWWFRNTWIWGCSHEGCTLKSSVELVEQGLMRTWHESLGVFYCAYDYGPDHQLPQVLFTENETNQERLFGDANVSPYVKDAFHDYVIEGQEEAVNEKNAGTKAAPMYVLALGPGESQIIRLRMVAEDETPQEWFGPSFDRTMSQRMEEADEFYQGRIPSCMLAENRNVIRQAYAGLLWSKQFYHYVVRDWLEGDAHMPPPPEKRCAGRNADWKHLFNRDVISMPDKWEYPWYAAWDLAFHMLPFSRIDPDFAKQQLILFLREWYMHPNGQIPAYEFNFSDVNPPVHAWGAWRVYKMTGRRGKRDRAFLESVFQKLLINFTWWVNRKDREGNNLFAGGFLGMDNIGIFDRSRPLPTGGFLLQADGTAWMGFYCLTMLSIALELAQENAVYEDLASKFFEHYVTIADAINTFGGTGLWDDEDGFYYDQLKLDGKAIPLKTRSMVGLLPLIAVEILQGSQLDCLPGFRKRMEWFLENRKDLAQYISFCDGCPGDIHRLLAIPSRERLCRVLRYLLDEEEFLSPYGIRSLSRVHEKSPYRFTVQGEEHCVNYVAGEGDTYAFGGNSNWRGPIWLPINFLIVEALEKYHHFYGNQLKIECPVGSGRMYTLQQAADEIARRLEKLFLPQEDGRRPCHGDDPRFAVDAHWKDLVLFHEYFHADNGQGLGASHQTGWTALAVLLLENAHQREC